jgi:hypothetical protein
VSFYSYDRSYQFISLDGARSAFEDSQLGGSKWTEHIVPQGKQIRTVETMRDKGEGKLEGFKWVGDDGEVLVAVGPIDEPIWREDPEWMVVTTLTLNHNQRLLGIRSASTGFKEARHYSFKWVICTEE